MITVNHGMIRASAGSGKTFQLARRFIRLLALGVAPEKIAALTFTRKAAGEFFDRILRQLARLAATPEDAGDYLPELLGWPRERIIGLLRSVIARMDRLRLSTMDSFFATMVRCLPFDLGLSGVGALLSDDEREQAMEDSLDALLREAMRPENDAARRALLEAWKRAFYGRETGSPVRDLEPWLRQMHPLYLGAPHERRWGHHPTIWPDKESAVWKADGDLKKAQVKVELQAAIERYSPEGQKFWDEFLEQLEKHIAGEPGFEKSRLGYMLDPKRGSAHTMEGGSESKVGRGKMVSLEPKLAALLREVLMILVGRELKVRCERTAGRRDLAALYEAAYHQRVRGPGRLVFADLPLLLAGKLGAAKSLEWEHLRLALEERLDSRYEHWLFDEFQDTSFPQWAVFENLIAEVLQDPTGQRSVFAVGDTKQSIYLWRDAEPELFDRVESSLPEARTDREPLTKSYRSCPAVLKMVNGVFQDERKLDAELPGISGWWQCPEHESAGDAAKQSGHAMLLSVNAGDHDGEGKAADAAVAALIRHVAPLSRGLSCAVIVRTNDEAARLSVRLRQLLKMEVMCESEEAVATDNPVTLALLSILRVAAHPSDTAAWEHLRMTPLAEHLKREGISAPLLGAGVRSDLAKVGFLGVSTLWLERIRGCAGGLDAFSERRGAQFLEIAAEIDETGSRDLDAFIRHARKYRLREDGAASAIQVMTVHKSKGLEFDIVILPQIGAKPLDSSRDKLLASRGENGEVEWFLESPPKAVWEWDGRLKNVIGTTQTRAAFEGMCRLYVAMTRAERALFVFLPDKPNVRSEGRILSAMLGTGEEARVIEDVPVVVHYESGDEDWFAGEKSSAPATTRSVATEPPPLKEMLRNVNHPLQRVTPSGEERLTILGANLLSPQRESSRGFGTLVHELFAEVEWLEGLTEADMDGSWKARGLDRAEGFPAAREIIMRVLAVAEIRAWFLKGARNREAWRERSFDLLRGSEWISGQLDRVVLERGGDGRVSSAAVLDFKTDFAPDEASMQAKAAGYAPQLALYRKAVSRLTGLPTAKIHTGLIFTGPGLLRWVGEG